MICDQSKQGIGVIDGTRLAVAIGRGVKEEERVGVGLVDMQEDIANTTSTERQRSLIISPIGISDEVFFIFRQWDGVYQFSRLVIPAAIQKVTNIYIQ